MKHALRDALRRGKSCARWVRRPSFTQGNRPGTGDASCRRMHLYLTARHFDLTPTIREYVEKRLVDAIQAHADAHDVTRVEVQLYLGQRDIRYGCHVLVQLSGHRDINITEENMDLRASIDLAEKRLIRCLTDARHRAQANQRHPRAPHGRRAEG